MGRWVRLVRTTYVVRFDEPLKKAMPTSMTTEPDTEPENDIGLTTVQSLIVVVMVMAACVLLAVGAMWFSGVLLEWFSR
jgi:hypothetical protein